MPNLNVLALFLLVPPLFMVGCSELPTTPPEGASLLISERDSIHDRLKERCPGDCRISFSLANPLLGSSYVDLEDMPWGDVSPNDTAPWIIPTSLP